MQDFAAYEMTVLFRAFVNRPTMIKSVLAHGDSRSSLPEVTLHLPAILPEDSFQPVANCAALVTRFAGPAGL